MANVSIFVPKLASTLSSILERTTKKNDSTIQAESETSLFHGQSKPAITIRAYLERIFRYTGCSPCCYLIAYIYLNRLVQHCPEAVIDSFSVHRLLITSVMVAAKFIDDFGGTMVGWSRSICIKIHTYWFRICADQVNINLDADRTALTRHRTTPHSYCLFPDKTERQSFIIYWHYSNAYYARVGGIEVSEMNSLELEFLFGMQFELNVSPNQFNSYCTMLEAEMCMESISSIPKLHISLLQEKHEGENRDKPTIQSAKISN